MQTLIRMGRRRILLLFVLLDAFCVGLGMGVPIFCILFGLPVGLIIA